VRTGRLAVFVVIPVAVVMVLFIVVLGTRAPASDRVADSPLVGRAAPGIQARTLEGEEFALDRYAGRWVLVNFFATWCGPCRREHPELRRFATEHDRTGDAGVVSVVFQDDPAAVRRFFDENGGDWPIVDDSGGRAVLDYGVAGIPESYLVDCDGVVRAKVTGGVTAAGLDGLIRELGSC